MSNLSTALAHEPLHAGVSRRGEAQQLCRAVLAGAPFSARTLVLDLDGRTCHCIYASGGEPVAIWDLELPTQPTADAVRALARQARLHALRGSVDELVTVRRKAPRGERPVGPVASLVSDALASELAVAGAHVAITTAARPRLARARGGDEVSSIVRTSADARGRRPATKDQPVDTQQDHRADDRRYDAGTRVAAVDVQGAAQEVREQCAGYAEQGRHDDATGVLARHEQLRDGADDQADDE
jgi:hypothetical protein